ncbi:glutathionylspermidine synthase family protein [Streptomyces montanus]|uniref:Glutathionylspermidine synthase family protein n=1 Tax=Streptomyces montanus TaxID=2580423 RepID=A0A5R9G2T9_9ACTN|nr:glutathionylspermidine synthase family protein [Streptomyces montanus]TLS45865.1 glutathionylspermidine synthase family protein [Streptomyces montanus]
MLMGSTSLHGGNRAADPVAEFQGIVQDVLDAAEESCGVEGLEQVLERALAVLQRNPDLRKQFETELISLIDSLEEGVTELVSFVMHELRWQAVEEAVRNRILFSQGNVSNLRLYEAILDSFSDSWRDRDLYSRFIR